MTHFSKGDRATFTASGSHRWNVSPSLLHLIQEAGNIQ